jgi:hypothetical protein
VQGTLELGLLTTSEHRPWRLSKGSFVFSKGNRRYMLVTVTVVAGVLASLGGGWFDGS